MTYRAIESGGNDFLVVLVAGIGFFTDSYILFASNVILPMLGYVYWNDSTQPTHETAINSATLAGCMLGMVIFGIAGDRYGRRKMYGIELLLLILGTIGVVMSSPGYSPVNNAVSAKEVDWGTYGSINILSLLLFFRFVSGCGIGGDYPLSAVIVSEFAPTNRRARMLATVFSMQAFGCATASIVSIIVVVIVRKVHPQASARSVDQIWRWVTGLGLLPAVAAVVLRLSIPETPRYTLDVLNDPFKAFEDSNRFNDSQLQEEYLHQSNMELAHAFASQKTEIDNRSQMSSTQGPDQRPIFEESKTTKITVNEFFFKEGNWRTVLGTSLAWFLLDFTFYGLGFHSPRTISKIWYTNIKPKQLPNLRIWDTDFSISTTDDNQAAQAAIYQMLIGNSVHSLLISSVGAIIGSFCLVLAIDHFNRKRFQYITFGTLGILFVIIGSTYQFTAQTRLHGVTIALYVLCQLCFYFGPNGLTFIIPAELFPTRFRCTCHGISAASGKFGSIIAQLFFAYVKFGNATGSGSSTSSSPTSTWLGWVLLILALPMFLGAFVGWLWIPQVQGKDGTNITLEELAKGRQRLAEAAVTGEEEGSDRAV